MKCHPRVTFSPTHPSVAGFLRRMLGRGEEPWAGALALALWLWVCTTVVAAEAGLKVLLIGLATMVAPSAKTTAGKDGHGHSRDENRQRVESSSYLMECDDKAGVCRAYIVHSLSPSVSNCSVFRLLCKQYCCHEQSDH